MRTTIVRATALLLVLLVLTTSCLGPNHAVGHLAKWNHQVDGKWGNEVVFILIFPAYIVFSFGDILIFNSWQWWTGHNPISRPGGAGPVTG